MAEERSVKASEVPGLKEKEKKKRKNIRKGENLDMVDKDD